MLSNLGEGVILKLMKNAPLIYTQIAVLMSCLSGLPVAGAARLEIPFAPKCQEKAEIRWAAFTWPHDPEWDGSCPPHYDMGEGFLIYPRARTSPRWEMLRDSIENYEKIRILRETGGMTSELEAALAAMTPDCVGRYEDEAAFKVGRAQISRQVRPVLKALDEASRN